MRLVGQDAAGEITRRTYQSGGFAPLTQSRVDAEFYAIVTDLVGTPVGLVDPDTGTVVGSASADLWGRAEWQGESTPLRFPGQYCDDESGLHYNLHRYYDPALGRYVTQDPLGLAPAANPSAYPHNPTAWIDPLGLIPCAPNHVVGPNGERIPAVQPGTPGVPAENNKGMVYPVAPGTPGLDPRVTEVRVMDPVIGGRFSYPDGYVVYHNEAGQRVNPITGRTTNGMADPYSHIPIPDSP